MKKYKTYTAEFKQQLVEQILSGAITQSHAARQNQISPTLISRWIKKFQQGVIFEDRPTAQEKSLERELERYKKKCAELLLENDLLKKLQKHSARTKRSSGSVTSMRHWASRSERPAE